MFFFISRSFQDYVDYSNLKVSLDECYIYFRYDTPSRTVEKYAKYFKNEPNLTNTYETLDDMFYHGC
mgnify:CR=1 FL=1